MQELYYFNKNYIELASHLHYSFTSLWTKLVFIKNKHNLESIITLCTDELFLLSITLIYTY